MKNNKWILISVVILTVGIIFSSVFLGYSIQKSTEKQTITQVEKDTAYSTVFTISEVAKYLTITEDDVRAIINTEKHTMDQMGSFTGMRFPYFTLDGKRYFSKDAIDEWLKEVSTNRREYKTDIKLVY